MLKWTQAADTYFTYHDAPRPGCPPDIDRVNSVRLEACCTAVLKRADANDPVVWSAAGVGALAPVKRLLKENKLWLTIDKLMPMMLDACPKIAVRMPKVMGILSHDQQEERHVDAVDLSAWLTAHPEDINCVFMMDETSEQETTLRKEPKLKVALRRGVRRTIVFTARFLRAGDRNVRRKYQWLSVINPLVGHVALEWCTPTPGVPRGKFKVGAAAHVGCIAQMAVRCPRACTHHALSLPTG